MQVSLPNLEFSTISYEFSKSGVFMEISKLIRRRPYFAILAQISPKLSRITPKSQG
ncbi:hypothetical protein KFK09_017852 [Dendrobium nobile]|uniref:Uncharacterized protein n=1 Tax=Dendrobium nobile TaxID=94219 RepID=A0A8T3AUA5_DENNO|nr:hypothetical protein KFK09_017852 [Dendrobium nobile]